MFLESAHFMLAKTAYWTDAVTVERTNKIQSAYYTRDLML